ncbi:MAG: hypothetical protein JNJ57_15970, partial [Saprospiraceae bacterium]|nr:hypothetical protein [Saprospiraceae bacterium]
MKKIAFVCLVLSFLIGYMEWPNNAAFLYEVAYKILFDRSETSNDAMMHPLVL